MLACFLRRDEPACAPVLLLAAPMGWAADDRDGDGIVDSLDNCLEHANPYQRDTDRDGIGNRCDPDFNQDGRVDTRDQVLLVHQFVCEPHGRSPSHERKGGPRDPGGDPPKGPSVRCDPLRARDFDLDGDGDVDPGDLHILQSFKGSPPGPRLDSEGDRLADLEDPCPGSPPGALPVRPGCPALDVVQRPESLTEPILTVTTEIVDDLFGATAAVPELAGIAGALGEGADAMREAARATRSGNPCGAGSSFGAAEAILEAEIDEFAPLILRARAGRGATVVHGDTFVEDTVVLALEAWRDQVRELQEQTAGVGEARTARGRPHHRGVSPPFAQGDTSWTQSQGNTPGCCGEPFSPDCCTSHNFAYAYDMVSPCGGLIRAARAGRVWDVVESNYQQVTDGCTPFECPFTLCCPDDSCGANQVVIRHQDGTFARYLHVRFAGAVPERGDLVRRGELLAYTGTTGPSSGPHLHYEIRTDLTASSPPFGTILALFEAVHPYTSQTLTCYEPQNYPATTDPDYLLRSNNKPWP